MAYAFSGNHNDRGAASITISYRILLRLIYYSQMEIAKIAGLNQSQRDRIAFVELRVRFLGEIRRQDLVTRFGIQTAAATRDLALYKELAPGNIEYDAKAKYYVAGNEFRPVFEFPPERIATILSTGFGDAEPTGAIPWIACESPSRLTQPDINILACVTRAIHGRYPLLIEYHSLSSGKTKREVVPFALIDTGLRWHVRAFDRKTQDFRDFVVTRIKNPIEMKDAEVLSNEQGDQDIQWTRILELELVPHPDQPRPEITAMDYGMTDGVLRMKLRAATAAYILRKWSVDCSPDHRLVGHEYRLWLKDHLALYGVKNALLSPGYESPIIGDSGRRADQLGKS